MSGQKRKSSQAVGGGAEPSAPPSAPAPSLLKSSEVSFPRGGASALTPLEVKEVANQAARDLLFESFNKVKQQKAVAAAEAEGSQRKKQKTSKKKQKNPKYLSTDGDKIKIEHLSARKCTPGSYVLGQVVEITRFDIGLALADNLVGYIPITNISSEVTKLVEQFEALSDDEDSDNDDDEEEKPFHQKSLPSINQLVKIGQWLRALVVDPTEYKTNKRYLKRIELSIEPALVNDLLEEDDLVVGQSVQASVKSVEDHGLVLNIGKHELTGFISKKEVEANGFKLNEITEGSVFLVMVSKKPTNSRVVSFNFHIPDKKTKQHPSVDKISSLDAVVPGNIVEAIVNEVTPYGVTCKVFGTINASLNLPNSGLYSHDALKSRFEIGGSFKAKVVVSVVSEGEKKLFLSLLPHILHFKRTPFEDSSFDPMEAYPRGFLLDSVTVKAQDAQYLYIDLGSGPVLGRVHISKLPENSDLNAQYYVGSKHKAKVISYSPFENQYILTMDPKELSQKFLNAADIPFGELVTGTIEEVSGTEGIVFKIYDRFRAYVPPNHISDIKLVYPERKYKVGSTVKGRILKVTLKGKIFATLKKSLVHLSSDYDQAILCDYETIKPGMRSAGTVEAIFPNGALVSFFGNVRGYLPKKEISEVFVKNIQDHLKIGHTVRVTVLSVDPENKKMSVSCKTTKSENNDAKSDQLSALKAGRSIVTAVVAKKTKDSILVDIKPGNARGVIYSNHLSDDTYEQNRQTFKALQIGEEIKTLVLMKDLKAKLAILTAKKSLVDDAESEKLPITFKDISKAPSGKTFNGYIRSITEKGLFIGFGGDLAGLLPRKYALKNKADAIDKRFKQHQSINCQVLRVSEENERFLLSFPDAIPDKKKQITENDGEYKVEVGETVPGKIKKIADSYLILELVQKKKAFCYITEALPNYDNKLNAVYYPGEVVSSTIISYDTDSHKYIVSLRRNFTKDKVKDKQVLTIEDIKVGDLIRGFVKNINDHGVYVSLGADIFALVRISDLSDDYVKNWKTFYKPGDLVQGKILAVKGEDRVLMSLRASHLTGDVLKTFDDLQKGDVFEGRVKSITDFGVFVSLAGTNNVSGLCHKSQISDDGPVENLTALFGDGDKVKVKVLDVNKKTKKMSLGMKASYFSKSAKQEKSGKTKDASEVADSEIVNDSDKEGSDSDSEDAEMLDSAFDKQNESDAEEAGEKAIEEDDVDAGLSASAISGLSTNGFDWTASILDQVDEDSEEEDDYENEMSDSRKRSKKSKKATQIVEDKTADLNTRAPQSVQDFERLLVGEPNSSVLWMNYMSFQLQLSEVDQAREIGQRALKMINYREEQEKMNIWIALLNLENTFGTDDTLQETFKKACQYMDSLTIHQKLAGIYILSEKKDEAEQLFKAMTKKFNKELSVWINFGKFYLENKKSDEARELLAKSLKALPQQDHVEIVKKFGQLEFKIGDAEQGRSLFEGLISDKPKRFDLWNVYIDQEIKLNEKQKVEELFERLFTKKLSNKQKKFFFSKWLQFEERLNDEKACNYIKAKAKAIAEAENAA